MQQEIEKLKQEKNKLTTEYENSRTEYKTEINKINRAIRSFEKGLSELTGTAVKTKRTKSHSEIETILKEEGALHLKKLSEKLNERGIPMSYQGLSGLMQLYAKAGKKFVKTAPATYALIEPNVVGEPDASAEPETAAKAHTAAKKRNLTKNKPNPNPPANAETIPQGEANGSGETETAETEKRTIVYEMDESEAGGNDDRQ